MSRADASVTQPPRRRIARVLLAVFLVSAFCGFCALGVWQVQRMHWKKDLIERVDSRVHAQPVAAPARAAWAGVSVDADEYRRVRLDGRFLRDGDVRTQAVTTAGAGFWLLSPFETVDGDIVLVNRGFVPTGASAAAAREGQQSVVGLLRLSEPDGGFLRSNAPADNRWYSRDVAAIAQARGLAADCVAPFFVDAERDAASTAWPRGGMTVVAFRDSHLSYALTWFGMALLTLVATWRLVVSARRLPQDCGFHTRARHAGTLQPP